MAFPTNRQEFKDHCLRELGAPVLEINVDEQQVEDRIDEALSFYWEYHFEGSEKQYYKIELSQEDIDNRYITMPENIINVIKIFDIGFGSSSTNSLFSIDYQVALQSIYNISNFSLISFYMNMQHIQLIQELLIGNTPLRYNRHINKLYIDVNWNKFSPGQYLIAEIYNIVDPNLYPDVWKDRWLLRYAAQLIKRQWGANLIKFAGLSLPGGVQFNGDKIYNDADLEVKQLESNIGQFMVPPLGLFG